MRQCGIVRRYVSPIVAESCGRQNGVAVELVQLGQFWRTFQIERWTRFVQRVPVFPMDVYGMGRSERGRWQCHAGWADYDLGPSPGIALQRHSIVSLAAQIPIAKHIVWIRCRVDRATPLPRRGRMTYAIRLRINRMFIGQARIESVANRPAIRFGGDIGWVAWLRRNCRRSRYFPAEPRRPISLHIPSLQVGHKNHLAQNIGPDFNDLRPLVALPLPAFPSEMFI